MTPVLANTPVIETERLALRAPAAADWPAWRGFAMSPRSAFIRTEELDEGLAWRAFGHVIGHWVLRGFGMFVFTLKGTDDALGMAGPWYPAGWPEREIGWTVWSEAAEGKGYAREAAAAARDHAFSVLGWTTAVSYIHPDNVRSIALADRLGATRDEKAAHPSDRPTLVYRHPAPRMRA
ncbi:GNAT family N-acetyltransferase [Defluviimonas sp. WL0024]|uniref:GNAT family N-acetyltransferase n=2 Tax=Albidovulum TaxID=205889 RepID=A0ABT3J419_9RHOB|nr:MULTISPECIES: GNAT family N-acetyltransferase [Defluviimonas]MCU9847875.1 GNAT family N-acetyltransferase [Defluviimonas sp. WL0024]MCW3782412.1 GNAT family N-acetyltransferase [Defluviimonas salinarum]